MIDADHHALVNEELNEQMKTCAYLVDRAPTSHCVTVATNPENAARPRTPLLMEEIRRRGRVGSTTPA